MMRHKIKILFSAGKKKFIEHLEDGYVGNKDVGYKNVKAGERDIVLTRVCRHFDDTEHKIKTPNTVELITQQPFVCYNLIISFFLVLLICSNIKLSQIIGGDIYGNSLL